MLNIGTYIKFESKEDLIHNLDKNFVWDEEKQKFGLKCDDYINYSLGGRICNFYIKKMPKKFPTYFQHQDTKLYNDDYNFGRPTDWIPRTKGQFIYYLSIQITKAENYYEWLLCVREQEKEEK